MQHLMARLTVSRLMRHHQRVRSQIRHGVIRCRLFGKAHCAALWLLLVYTNVISVQLGWCTCVNRLANDSGICFFNITQRFRWDKDVGNYACNTVRFRSRQSTLWFTFCSVIVGLSVCASSLVQHVCPFHTVEHNEIRHCTCISAL